MGWYGPRGACGCCDQCDRACGSGYGGPWLISSPLSLYVITASLAGVTDANSDNGTLYCFIFINPSPGIDTGIYLYSVNDYTDSQYLVAKYEAPGAVAGDITLVTQNDSGVTGTMNVFSPGGGSSGTITSSGTPCNLNVNGQDIYAVEYELVEIEDPFVIRELLGFDGSGNPIYFFYEWSGTSGLIGQISRIVAEEECGECYQIARTAAVTGSLRLWDSRFPGSATTRTAQLYWEGRHFGSPVFFPYTQNVYSSTADLTLRAIVDTCVQGPLTTFGGINPEFPFEPGQVSIYKAKWSHVIL